MRTSRPPAATAHFVAKLLAVLPMPASSVPQFMAKIDGTLRGLNVVTPDAITTKLQARAQIGAVSDLRARPTAVAARPSTASASSYNFVPAQTRSLVSSEFSSAELPEIAVIPARRRGRPPGSGKKIVQTIVSVEESEEITAPAQSRLLRRADITIVESTHQPIPSSLQPSSDGPIHGVIKWFDGRSGKGALRLAGIGDVALEQRVLDDSHVKRVYRDQEVEAHVELNGSKVRLLSISIPNRTDAIAAQPFGNAGDTTRTVKRQPRTVVVEIKRDTSKRRRSRAEAEQAFGGDTMVLPVR